MQDEARDLSAERVGYNEATFREANDRIRAAAEEHEVDAPIPFLCECADEPCREIVRLSLRAYADVRVSASWFFVATGHQAAMGRHGRVIADHGAYLVVEKIGRAAEAAEEAYGDAAQLSVERGPEELDERERRKARNEALFRKVNEQLESVNEAFGSVSGTFAVICECDDVNCAQQLELPRSEYEAVRADPTLFIIATGHANDRVEGVIRESDGLQVVKKRDGAPSAFAEATDPRAPR